VVAGPRNHEEAPEIMLISGAFCFPQLLPDVASERSAEASATLLPGL